MAHILVVDDEVDLAWALRQSLSDEGYEVSIAQDGQQAIAAVARQCPDLIILDINMPRMDGLEVCRRLRRDPSCAAVPVLFLTVRSGIQDRIKGLDEGGDDYLSKPFDLGELKARVRALLRRAQPVATRLGAGSSLRNTGRRDYYESAHPPSLSRRETCRAHTH